MSVAEFEQILRALRLSRKKPTVANIIRYGDVTSLNVSIDASYFLDEHGDAVAWDKPRYAGQVCPVTCSHGPTTLPFVFTMHIA